MIERSSLLHHLVALRHGFGTRIGGVSEGIFASLNLGRDVGDNPTAVEDNYHCFRHLVGLADEVPIVELNQVHGHRIVMVESHGDTRSDADGMITLTPGIALGVRTADCAPVLIAHGSSRVDAIAAVHAGWRGATERIVPLAIDQLISLGARLEKIRVAIGPSIGLAKFQVGDEVVKSAQESLLGEAPPITEIDGRPHLDLRALIVRQLELLGVPREQIDLVGGCTASEPERYFSHRRDQGRTGRHLSVVAIDDH